MLDMVEQSSVKIEKMIVDCLNNFAIDDAVHVAELYFNRVQSDKSVELLARALIQQNRCDAACRLLELRPAGDNPQLRFMLAHCLHKLNRFEEAQRTLTGEQTQLALDPIFVDAPCSPFAHALLATVLSENYDKDKAAIEYQLALTHNPFLWSSFQQFAQLVQHDQPPTTSSLTNIVDVSPAKPAVIVTPLPVLATEMIAPPLAPKKTRRPPTSMITRGRGAIGSGVASPRRSQRLTQDSENAVRCERPYRSPGDKQLRSINRIIEGSLSPEQQQLIEPPRKSSPSRKAPPSVPSSNPIVQPQCRIYDEILQWQSRLMSVFSALSKYDNEKALRELDGFRGTAIDNSPLVLELRGRAHFNNNDYQQAVKSLQRIRNESPWHMGGVALLSTALWHTQDAHALSALSHELTRGARDRAETWCVVGNCMSLKQDRDKAIECLERAVRLEPRFAYAYSLLGHELTESGQLDRAAQAFRVAIRYCPNEYRAHYGLGMVHFRREQMVDARGHFTRALRVNPNCIQALCQMADVDRGQANGEVVSRMLRETLEKHPDNVHCMFNYAKSELNCGRPTKALEMLELLKTKTPDEAQVYLLLGQVHQRLGNAHQAMVNLAHASQMDPRGDQGNFHATYFALQDDTPFHEPPL